MLIETTLCAVGALSSSCPTDAVGDSEFWENEDEDEDGEVDKLFDRKERQLSFESKLYGYQMEKQKEKAKEELLQSMQGRATALEDFELLKVLGKGSFGKVRFMPKYFKIDDHG